MSKLANIKYIIWDLDGTLYPFSQEMDRDCVAAAAKAAIDLGFTGPQHIAESLAEEGFRQANNGLEIFVDHYGLSLADLHRVYHTHIGIDHLLPYDELIPHMRDSTHTHAILTHGSSDWAKRIIAQRQLTEFFKEHHIVGMEHYQFQKKHKHYEPFEHTLRALGDADPKQVAIVEDSARNLVIPHEMGMTTVLLVGDDVESYEKPEYVDYVASSPEAFMKTLARCTPKETATSRRSDPSHR